MAGKDWWLVLEEVAPGTMPDDADTCLFGPGNSLHVASGALEGAGLIDGCNGEVCGWWPCQCEELG